MQLLTYIFESVLRLNILHGCHYREMPFKLSSPKYKRFIISIRYFAHTNQIICTVTNLGNMLMMFSHKHTIIPLLHSVLEALEKHIAWVHILDSIIHAISSAKLLATFLRIRISLVLLRSQFHVLKFIWNRLTTYYSTRMIPA